MLRTPRVFYLDLCVSAWALHCGRNRRSEDESYVTHWTRPCFGRIGRIGRIIASARAGAHEGPTRQSSALDLSVDD